MLQGRPNRMRIATFCLLGASLLAVLPLYHAAGQAESSKASASDAAADSLPEGAGKQLVLKNCQTCHALRIVTSNRGTADDWAQVVSQMIGRGANLSDSDADTIVDYLAAHYGPSAKPSQEEKDSQSGASSTSGGNKAGDLVNVNQASADVLQSKLGLTEDQANAVLDYRKQKGPFKNLDQLLTVPGLDAGKIKDEKNKITF